MASWSTTSLTTFSCLENRFMTPWSSLLALSSYIQESGPRKRKLDSTKITQKRVNCILKMVLNRPIYSVLMNGSSTMMITSWTASARSTNAMAWTCRTPPCSNLYVCQPSPINHQTQVPGTHLGLSGVGARATYLWVQKCFVLAKQLIHFKPSLLVDLSDN